MNDNVCPISGKICYLPKLHQITELKDGKVVKTFKLCNQCFYEYISGDKNFPKPKPKLQVDPEQANAFVENLMKFAETMIQQQGSQFSIPQKGPCPKCNQSINKINKTGRMGCPNCYVWFDKELKPVLYYLHKTPYSPENIIHTGKKPKKWKKSAKPQLESSQMKLVKLKFKLAKAVQAEDYEQAAKYRDKIRDLENEITSSSSSS